MRSELNALIKLKITSLIVLQASITLPVYSAICDSTKSARQFAEMQYSGDIEVPGNKNKIWNLRNGIGLGYVIPTNPFLRGENKLKKNLSLTAYDDFGVDFRYNPNSLNGKLYKGLYTGLGIRAASFFEPALLGDPISLYAYQGAPFWQINHKLQLGYEWKFGLTGGWTHYDQENLPENLSIGAPLTAHIGLGVKLSYKVSKVLQLWANGEITHFSNGNTCSPNAGLNTLGLSLGADYTLNPYLTDVLSPKLPLGMSDRGWFYDIALYGAVRKRVIHREEKSILIPGRFAIVGFQSAAMHKLSHRGAIGFGLDMQFDEGAGLSEYLVEGTSGEFVRFYRPSFFKQLHVGPTLHAQLTAPIFTVDTGVGYDIINPKENKAFYQFLTLKTFFTNNIFLNIGYRLGGFKYQQNLMIGLGYRFKNN